MGASAAMDLSDGLSSDLGGLAESSGVAAHVDAEAVPRFEGASLEQALHGGEEYELLFTAPPAVEVPHEHGGLLLHRLGQIEEGSGVFLREEGRVRPLLPGGYEHFA